LLSYSILDQRGLLISVAGALFVGMNVVTIDLLTGVEAILKGAKISGRRTVLQRR
jgi:hypothetical protein